jgi:hypothetical protein
MEQDQVSLLKQMIADKSIEQEAEKLLLMEHFHQAYESIKPINIVKGAVEGLLATTGLKTTIINGVLGFVAGLVVKKFANGKVIRTLVGKLS